MNKVIFSNKRTQCPNCGAKHSKAQILEYCGQDVSNDDYFKCFSCESIRTPKTEKQYTKISISNYDIEKVESLPYDINGLFDYSISLKHTDNFSKYLMNIWGAENEFIESYLDKWNIGSDSNSNTVFWYTNSSGEPFYCKSIQYSYNTCKRNKDAFIGGGLQFRNKFIPINKAGGKNGLFGLNQIHSKEIVLVEAEKTAILSSFHYFDLSFVATGGTQNFKIEYLNQIPKESELFIMFDVDGPGQNSQSKLSNLLKSNGIRHGIIDYSDKIKPYGTDLADYMLYNRGVAFYAE